SQQSTSSSVVVIVATSASELSTIVSVYSGGTPAMASRGRTTSYARFTASNTAFGIATFDDTPTITSVVTPRLRRIESTSVPAIGPRPCKRVEMMSSSDTVVGSAT